MKPHTWNMGKNTKLKTERGVSFEMVRNRLNAGAFKIRLSPSKSHPGQKAYILTLHGVRYAVPFSETKNAIILLTIMRYQP